MSVGQWLAKPYYLNIYNYSYCPGRSRREEEQTKGEKTDER